MQARATQPHIHLLSTENDQYVDSLKRVICEIAQKLEAKAPHLKLYSDSEQNKRTYELYRSYPEPQKNAFWKTPLSTIRSSILCLP